MLNPARFETSSAGTLYSLSAETRDVEGSRFFVGEKGQKK